ncbi:MAG: rRNA pseudouridine synthase [Saprospiraceae bacterium]|nr:rRNA pseudouridine synthase [Saprospiraceae bacterium]
MKKRHDEPKSNWKKSDTKAKKTTNRFDTESIEGMRLNKYVAKSGVCSRRQAADLIKKGEVSVNGKVVLEPFYQVQATDKITHKGKTLQPELQLVYLLMNKPKDTITTASDEKGRRTVLDLIGKEIRERVFPVGRLDRMTTGLLLLTNDGDIAKKLSHPSHEIKKAYQVELDKPLTEEDLLKIKKGLVLEDGPTPVDEVGYADGNAQNIIGIVIHIGRNRVVRRIFAHLGYEVVRLDRTYYAGLTKKDLGRGRYRHLTEREVVMLKHFS